MPRLFTRSAPDRHGNHRQRKSHPLIALNLAIVLVVGGGTAAYGALSHTVTLSVDGASQTVRTFGGTVADVLDDNNVTVRAGDRMNTKPSAAVSDGDKIAISYAKPVEIAVDGAVTKHTVYASTVGQVLKGVGVAPPADAYVSAKPTASVPRKGMKVVVSTPKTLTVVADGKKSKITTTAPTVSRVLDAAGVALDADDEVKPAKSAFVTAGDTLRVARITKTDETETVKVKYPTEVRKDPEASEGDVKVLSKGKKGKAIEKVTLVYADGKLRDRNVLSSQVLEQPVVQVESHGTATTPPDSVWDKIARCESGGNWSINSGNGYYGGLQFSAATWRSVGGPGLPHENSREVQIKFAKILQARSGWGQWGCAGARFN